MAADPNADRLLYWEFDLWNLLIYAWPYERWANGYTPQDVKDVVAKLIRLGMLRRGRMEFRKRMTSRGHYALNRWRDWRDNPPQEKTCRYCGKVYLKWCLSDECAERRRAERLPDVPMTELIKSLEQQSLWEVNGYE